MKKRYTWGIMGAGIIARKMAAALQESDRSVLLWVGSKSTERARTFATEMNVPRHGSYEELLSDPEVEIVYVATTHNFHYENALLALERGKHLLIEKPITVNAPEARVLMNFARSRELFLMEALWSRFIPTWQRMRELIREGEIGEVRLITVTFGKFAPPRFVQRLNDPALAGGTTLDLGVYALSFCCFMTGQLPAATSSTARLNSRGVDELAAYQLSFSGAIAQITTSFNLAMQDRATLYGTLGYMELEPFPGGNTFTLVRHDGTNEPVRREEITLPQAENGFVYQVAEVADALDRGRLESPDMPSSESVAIMELMDGMRKSWGVRYGNDR